MRSNEQRAETRRLRGALAWLCVASLYTLTGCGTDDPYDYRRVSGRVTYEDGSLIPAERITVKFLPLAAPIDRKTHPRAGEAEVNVADGSFDLATTRRYGDGIVAGRHRVLVVAYDDDSLPTAAISERYADPTRTPLEVDTADSPFHLKVK